MPADVVRFTGITPNNLLPLHTPWYGMREFAIHDSDGHLLTFAERVAPA